MELERNWQRRSYSAICDALSWIGWVRNEMNVRTVIRKTMRSQKKAVSRSRRWRAERRDGCDMRLGTDILGSLCQRGKKPLIGLRCAAFPDQVVKGWRYVAFTIMNESVQVEATHWLFKSCSARHVQQAQVSDGMNFRTQ